MGTIGIPDRILLKPGRLTPRGHEIMRTHTTLAFDAIESGAHLGLHAGQLQLLKSWCIATRKWDGSGYPRGGGQCDSLVCALVGRCGYCTIR